MLLNRTRRDSAALIQQAIGSQTIEALARRSSLVVVGRTAPSGARCSAYGRPIKCAEVLIDSVVAGESPSGTLRVHSLFGGLATYSSVLLMLRRSGGDAYEVVGFEGGVLPIANGHLTSSGQSVSQAVHYARAGFAKRSEP